MINPKIFDDLPHDFNLFINIKKEDKIKAYNILDQLHSKGIFLSLNKPAANLKDVLERSDLKTNDLLFIDCVSKHVEEPLEIENCEYASLNLPDISLAITKASEKIGHNVNKFLILDSLHDLLMYYDKETALKFMKFLIERMRTLRINGIVLNAGEIPKEFLRLFDKVIEI